MISTALVSHSLGTAWKADQHEAGHHWSARILRTNKASILIAASYWPPGPEQEERCQQQRSVLAQVIRAHGLPYLLFGDWNQPPSELQESQCLWLEHIKGHVVHPPVAQTCSTGTGRVLDYVVCSDRLRHLLKLDVDMESPWSPHLGVEATLQVDPAIAQYLAFPALPLIQAPLVEGREPTPQEATQRWQQVMAARPTADHKAQEPWFPVRACSTSKQLDQMYATFSQTAEAYLRPAHTEQTATQTPLTQGKRVAQGRCAIRTLRLQSMLQQTQPHQHASQGWLSYWQALRARLRDLAKLIKKSWTKPAALPSHRAQHYHKIIAQIPHRLHQLAGQADIPATLLTEITKVMDPLIKLKGRRSSLVGCLVPRADLRTWKRQSTPLLAHSHRCLR